MGSSNLFNARINNFLVDYALTIACLVCIAVSYVPGSLVYIERIELPDVEGFSVVPTLALANGKPRHWATNLGTASVTCIGYAAVAAIPIVIFFFFDQNVSSLLCQTPGKWGVAAVLFH